MTIQIKIKYISPTEKIRAFDIKLLTNHTIQKIYNVEQKRTRYINYTPVEKNFIIKHSAKTTKINGKTCHQIIGYGKSNLHYIPPTTEDGIPEDLMVIEFAEEIFLDDLEIMVDPDGYEGVQNFKIVNPKGNYIDDCILTTQLINNDPRVINVFYTNKTSEDIIAGQIDFKNAHADFDKSNTVIHVKKNAMRLITGQDRAVIIPILNEDGTMGNGNILKNTSGFLLSARFSDIPDPKLLFKEYIFSNDKGEELKTPSEDVLSRDVSGTNIFNATHWNKFKTVSMENDLSLNETAYLTFDLMAFKEISPKIISANTSKVPNKTPEAFGINLIWENQSKYNFYDFLIKIEIWRRRIPDVKNQPLVAGDYHGKTETALRELNFVKKYIFNKDEVNGNGSNWTDGKFMDTANGLNPEHYYEYVIRGIYSEYHKTSFSSGIITRFCPPIEIKRCPKILLPRNNVLVGNTLSEKRRFSQRVRSWSRR